MSSTFNHIRNSLQKGGILYYNVRAQNVLDLKVTCLSRVHSSGTKTKPLSGSVHSRARSCRLRRRRARLRDFGAAWRRLYSTYKRVVLFGRHRSQLIVALAISRLQMSSRIDRPMFDGV